MALKIRSSAVKAASITPTQSTTLVKNLFRAAFSSVAYIRNFFNDDCFELGKIGLTQYHKIVGVEKEEVRLFVDWLEQGVFHALQHKYLEVVLLEVFASDKPKGSNKKKTGKKQLLECFSFKVSYDKNGAQFHVSGSGGTSRPLDSKEHIKRNTSEVLRSLVALTHSLRPLPPNRILSMKLLYTKNTPSEYEPPLFSKAPEDDLCWFDEKPLRASAGIVTTPYHQLSMSIRVASSQENKKMHALESRSTENCMDIEQGQNGQQKRAGASASDDTMVVDVGDSQTNTARPIAAKVVKESQILKEGSSEGEVIEKVRVREVHNEGEQEGICGSTVEGSRVTGWSRPYRKRKASEVEKCITQGEPPRTRRKR